MKYYIHTPHCSQQATPICDPPPFPHNFISSFLITHSVTFSPTVAVINIMSKTKLHKEEFTLAYSSGGKVHLVRESRWLEWETEGSHLNHTQEAQNTLEAGQGYKLPVTTSSDVLLPPKTHIMNIP